VFDLQESFKLEQVFILVKAFGRCFLSFLIVVETDSSTDDKDQEESEEAPAAT